MSWSPELPIGEFRPWPDTVHVVRGRTGEMLRYVPEQAVAATLGPGTCKDATSDDHTQAFTCSECGCWVAYDEYWETGIYVEGEGQAVHIHPNYCPNCGRKVEAI